MPKFIVDIELDGFTTEETLLVECQEILKEKLDFEGSSVTIEPYKSQGKSTGGRVPFGYQCEDGINLTINLKEQEIITTMNALRKEKVSYRGIAKEIEKLEGVKLSHAGVRRILNRELESNFIQTKFIF